MLQKSFSCEISVTVVHKGLLKDSSMHAFLTRRSDFLLTEGLPELTFTKHVSVESAVFAVHASLDNLSDTNSDVKSFEYFFYDKLISLTLRSPSPSTSHVEARIYSITLSHCGAAKYLPNLSGFSYISTLQWSLHTHSKSNSSKSSSKSGSMRGRSAATLGSMMIIAMDWDHDFTHYENQLPSGLKLRWQQRGLLQRSS